MLKLAIIMRGVPGSGKSFLAGKLGGKIFSTDDQHINAKGVYRYLRDKALFYHTRNKERFLRAVKKGVPIVICDNTNFKQSLYAIYVNDAADHGYLVWSITFLPHNVSYHMKRNRHNVPKDIVEYMIDNFERRMRGADREFRDTNYKRLSKNVLTALKEVKEHERCKKNTKNVKTSRKNLGKKSGS